MQDFSLTDLVWIGGMLAVLVTVGILRSQHTRIVSALSRWNAGLIERGRAQQARRARLHGYADYVTHEPVPVVPIGPVPLPGTGAPAIDISFLAGNLTEAQYIELGARLQDRRGKFVFSGKTLYKIAGGNHDEFLANMRLWRGEEIDESVHVTPIVGRRTSAQFDYDDPQLRYQPPA